MCLVDEAFVHVDDHRVIRLLLYVRPLWYYKDESTAHPLLGERAILIRPLG